MVCMKVIKEGKEFRNVTLRLSEDTMRKIDEVAEENEVSRQKLIEAILEQALGDKNFVVRLR
jgi:predicted transcriptional regulator